MTWGEGNKADTSQGASGHRFEVSTLRQQVASAITNGSKLRVVHRVNGKLDAVVDTPKAWRCRTQFSLNSGQVLDLNLIDSVELIVS